MLSQFPQTNAVRRVLDTTTDSSTIADLLFLELWATHPMPGAAAALRVTQIRRANPGLAAAIEAELTGPRHQ